jgi:hypothetical protein
MVDIAAEQECFDFLAEDAKRFFGQWDICDPVSWALVHVVQAQNDLANAYDVYAWQGANMSMLETAFKERIDAIAALQKAIEKWPRGFL